MPALDTVLQKILPGDNIVWQVDSIEDYIPFVHALAGHMRSNKKNFVYFRFASHSALLSEKNGVKIYTIDPLVGFETFTIEIRKIVQQYGSTASFVFDCLSDLPVHWYSDLMLGNFFVLICPYILQHGSLAYFALLRYHHSFPVATRIRATTQILIDAYRYEGNMYIHPIKVEHRHSPTMYLPHVMQGDDFNPVTDSATISKVVVSVKGYGMKVTPRLIDVWDRTFIEAEYGVQEFKQEKESGKTSNRTFEKLLRMVISNDDRVLRLAKTYLTIEDIIEIKKRLVGTGRIGGKSVGMLIARAIMKRSNERWNTLLEMHDSFYIGSDVYYTFIVLNDCWVERQKQRDPETFLDGTDEARKKILAGIFPQDSINQFVEMLDYFGQTPIIVRSSSLLEDNFGNAFSGKYESVFCVNQGTPDERLEAFLAAVKQVYASTMSTEALMYRYHRGLLDRDEQMALLVQRVSGAVYGNVYLPLVAGVGLSHNPYSWCEKIDPESGVIRLVCGLGTRAVDRHDNDYTRVVALNAPELTPEENFNKVKKYSQKQVDVLNLTTNELRSIYYNELKKSTIGFPSEIVSSPASETGKNETDNGNVSAQSWILTFEKLLSETTFVENMRDLLRTLQNAYEYPVDTEFTANFKEGSGYRINLLQCRPLQTADRGFIVEPPDDIDSAHIIIDTRSAIIGPSLMAEIGQIIYVVPSEYQRLREQEKYDVARLVGRLTHPKERFHGLLMLIGPGRWGTSMASLGVPVTFAEINTVSIIVEVIEMNANVIPDVSLGTHFFNDIVETKMLYLTVFPHQENSVFNRKFFMALPNKLLDLVPGASRFADVVRVIDANELPDRQDIILNANPVRQRALCYIERA